MEKCNCKKLEQERDAAIAENTKLFEINVASFITTLAMEKKLEALEKDAQGLVAELKEIAMLIPCHEQCSTASVMAENALKAWEGREK